MNDKKNIDRFFQEKFKDFETEPNEIVWQNIEANLKKRGEKRSVIPFWLQLSGIAVALILGIFSINNYFGKSKIENILVLEEKSSEVKSKSEFSNSKKPIQYPDENKINSKNHNIVVITNKAADSKKLIVKKENHSLKNKVEIFEKIIVEKHKHSSESKNQISVKTNKFFIPINKFRTNLIAYKTKKATKVFYVLVKSEKAKNYIGSKNDKNNKANLNEKQLAESEINIENKSPSNIIWKYNLDENKDKLIERITDQKSDEKKSDAVAKVETVTNALEQMLKKNEEEEKKVLKTKLNRWQITSNVSPIYFNSTSNGSPIDSEFAQNQKTYDNNVSFGLGVNYAVSKKIKIRSGMNKFTLGYSTKDVVFQAGLSRKTLNNISTSGNGATVIITNKDNSTQNLMAFEQNINSFNEGQINQKMGYYEIPLEMSYLLIDKKLGIDLIGGLSTLILTENRISVSSANLSTDVGKANNLSDVHFSTNLGVGFKYRFFKTFEVKLEPTFKYQINTFSNNVGGFKPYLIGLYSGVSFSF